MGQFTQDGIIYEEMPDGQVRVVGYADAPSPTPGGRVFTLPLTPEKAKEEARKDRDQQLQEESANRQATAAERQADTADRTANNQKYDNVLKLRSDFDALPPVKEYRTAVAQLATGLKTKPDATGDNALIYAYAKAMDPGSVVRESEMGMAASGASAIDSAVAGLKKQFGFEGGGQLPPAIRDRMRREMLNKVGELNRVYSAQRNRFIEDAKAFGIDPQRVVGNHDGDAFRPIVDEYVKQQNEKLDKTSSIMPNALSADQQTVATGDTKTETVRGPVEKQLSAMLQKGTPSANIRAFAKQNNFPAGKVERVLAWRAMNPQYKGPYNVSTEVITPTSPFNKFEASPLATIATQAANATSAGTLDEIGGAVNSLVTGDPLSESIAAGDMNKQMQAQLNKKSALVGNVIGGTAAMLGGGALVRGALASGAKAGLGRNALAWAARNPIKAAAVGDAGYGAAYGAGEMNDNRLGGAAIGAPAALLGSLAGSGATKAIGSAVRGVVDPAVDRLRASGIPLTVGETLGGGWKRAQDALTTVFGPGDMVARRYNEGRRALNETAFNAAGNTVGTPINAVGQEGVDLLNQAKNKAYSEALDPARINLAGDPQFSDDILSIGSRLSRLPNDDQAREAAMNAIQFRIGNNIDSDGGMSGRNFQEAYRGLARAPRERGANKAYAHEFGQTMREAQDALAGTLERQEPGAYQGFLNANTANRHLNVLADAVNAAKNQIDDGGEILVTPAQLNTSATRNANTYGGKLAAAMGNKPFNQLINDSQQVMSSKLPTSGTGERILMTSLIGGGGGALGGGVGYGADGGEGATVGALAPAAVLTLLGTRRGQQALTAALLNRAAPFRRAGTAIRNNANIGGDVLTSAGIPLLYPPSP